MPRATCWQTSMVDKQVAVEHRADVRLLDQDRIVGVGLAAGCRDVAAGVVDQDVDRAELGLDPAHDLGDLRGRR